MWDYATQFALYCRRKTSDTVFNAHKYTPQANKNKEATQAHLIGTWNTVKKSHKKGAEEDETGA